MRRLTAEDYAVDAVTMAKALVGAWLCLRVQARPETQMALYVKQGQYMNKVRSDIDECKGRKERKMNYP